MNRLQMIGAGVILMITVQVILKDFPLVTRLGALVLLIGWGFDLPGKIRDRLRTKIEEGVLAIDSREVSFTYTTLRKEQVELYSTNLATEDEHLELSVKRQLSSLYVLSSLAMPPKPYQLFCELTLGGTTLRIPVEWEFRNNSEGEIFRVYTANFYLQRPDGRWSGQLLYEKRHTKPKIKKEKLPRVKTRSKPQFVSI